MGRSPWVLSATAARYGALLVALSALTLPSAASAQQATEVVTPSTPSSKSGEPTIGGFSARALDESGNLTPQTYFKLDLPPGGTYSGRLLISNATEARNKLRVYSVDGLTGATTGTVYANKNDPRAETSTWIEPSRTIIGVEPESQRRLHFTVRVPQDATPGDHVGAIALQSATNPKSSGQFAVKEIIRVAVAVQITVKGAASAALKIDSLKLNALGGTQIPSVVSQLNNTGQLLCRPEITVAMKKDGASIGTVTRQLDTVLPGDSIAYPLAWPRALTSGKYQATASTTGCGPPSTRTADLELKDALRGTPQTPGTNIAPESGGGVPWWALVLTAVAALGGGFFLARRGPKERKDETPKDEPAAQV